MTPPVPQALLDAGTQLMLLLREQADDAALWAAEETPQGYRASTPNEDYVRARLRELHAAVEQYVESATGGGMTATCPVCEGRAHTREPGRKHCFGCLAARLQKSGI